MIACFIVVELLILSGSASKRTLMSHDYNLSFWVWVLLQCHIPKLVEIFIEITMILILVRERAPAFFKWPLPIILNIVLDTSSQPNNNQVIFELENPSVNIPLDI